MTYRLTFSKSHKYDPGDNSITVPVTLSVGQEVIDFPAKIDTGSVFCIFQREYGEALSLNIESGIPERVGTVTGSSFQTYGHEVSLSVLGFQFDVIVYFASDYGFRRNVLGRRGWIQQVRLGIIDYDGELYVSKYDDQI